MTNEDRRWVEIRFYYAVSDIVDLKKDMYMALEFIDTLLIFDSFNPTLIKQYAVQCLQSAWIRPSREETVILGKKYKRPIKTIKDRLRIHNRTLYMTLERHSDDGFFFLPKLELHQHEEIIKFLSALDKVKGLGI